MEFKHELVIPNDDLPFKMFLFEGKDGNYVREKHWHRSIEIFAVFEGQLNFYMNDQAYPLHRGDFVLVNSNEVHSVFSPVPNKTVVLQIPLAVFQNYYTDELFIRFSHSPHRQDEKVMGLVDEMYQTYMEGKMGYELKVQSQFYMLIYLLVTKYRKTEVNASAVRHSKKLDRLSVITGYIRDHYREELSLEQLAGIFGYSPTYLSKMFQKYAMTNYKAYLQNIRIEYGLKDLLDSDLTIGEIAVKNGFPDGRAFSKALKKKSGMLPSEYRKNSKSKSNRKQ